jgi:6-phosphogluconolactonase
MNSQGHQRERSVSHSRDDDEPSTDGSAANDTINRSKSWRLEVLPSIDDLVHVASELVNAAALISISQRNAFRIALAGGSTPRPLYEHLALDPDIDWRKWHLFWGDERSVPPTGAESNYQMVRASLLDRLATAPGLVVRVQAELAPAEAALRYEQSIRELVPSFVTERTGFLPRFDMVVLGMGDDGHTASLFPHTKALHETERLVVANAVPQLDTTRITFTYPLINAARRILILVSGANKAKALRQVISGPYNPEQLPIQKISPVDGQIFWLVDEAAFAEIDADMA